MTEIEFSLDANYGLDPVSGDIAFCMNRQPFGFTIARVILRVLHLSADISKGPR